MCKEHEEKMIEKGEEQRPYLTVEDNARLKEPWGILKHGHSLLFGFQDVRGNLVNKPLTAPLSDNSLYPHLVAILKVLRGWNFKTQNATSLPWKLERGKMISGKMDKQFRKKLSIRCFLYCLRKVKSY